MYIGEKMPKISFTKKHLYILITVIVSVALDQLSKFLVSSGMTLGKKVTVIPYIFDFRYIINRGAAFGMLAEHRWVFMIVSSAAIIALCIYCALCAQKLNNLYIFGIAMIIGGGIGNMIDRIALGYVVDFIEFAFVDFATFNIADSFVCVGACVVGLALIIDIVKENKKAKSNNTKNNNAENK